MLAAKAADGSYRKRVTVMASSKKQTESSVAHDYRLTSEGAWYHIAFAALFVIILIFSVSSKNMILASIAVALLVTWIVALVPKKRPFN